MNYNASELIEKMEHKLYRDKMQKIEEEMRASLELDMAIEKLNSKLKDRVLDIIAMAEMCDRNKILDKDFYSDGFYHTFGFFKFNGKPVLGWKNGGACGQYDVIFDANGISASGMLHPGMNANLPRQLCTRDLRISEINKFESKFADYEKTFVEWFELKVTQ